MTSTSLLSRLAEYQPRPEAVVVDLDYTLWAANVEDFAGPVARTSSAMLTHLGSGRSLSLFGEVEGVLRACFAANIPIAVASASPAAGAARACLASFGLAALISAWEVHPGKKTIHLAAIKKALDCSFDRMIFFDDRPHNIRDVGTLGCTCVRVDGAEGLTAQRLLHGLSSLRATSRAAGAIQAWLHPRRASVTDGTRDKSVIAATAVVLESPHAPMKRERDSCGNDDAPGAARPVLSAEQQQIIAANRAAALERRSRQRV